MLSSRRVLNRISTFSRSFHSRSLLLSSAEPKLQPQPTQVNVKLEKLVDEIEKLTLIETADFIKVLKKRLNIEQVLAPAVSAPAPVQQEEKVEEKQPEVQEQKEFTLKLVKFDAASKAKVIKEIKALMPGMNLVEAKKFVESCPKVVKENLSKEEADKLKKVLESVGGEVALE